MIVAVVAIFTMIERLSKQSLSRRNILLNAMIFAILGGSVFEASTILVSAPGTSAALFTPFFLGSGIAIGGWIQKSYFRRFAGIKDKRPESFAQLPLIARLLYTINNALIVSPSLLIILLLSAVFIVATLLAFVIVEIAITLMALVCWIALAPVYYLWQKRVLPWSVVFIPAISFWALMHLVTLIPGFLTAGLSIFWPMILAMYLLDIGFGHLLVYVGRPLLLAYPATPGQGVAIYGVVLLVGFIFAMLSSSETDYFSSLKGLAIGTLTGLGFSPFILTAQQNIVGLYQSLLVFVVSIALGVITERYFSRKVALTSIILLLIGMIVLVEAHVLSTVLL